MRETGMLHLHVVNVPRYKPTGSCALCEKDNSEDAWLLSFSTLQFSKACMLGISSKRAFYLFLDVPF
jgi:hypothetical protein